MNQGKVASFLHRKSFHYPRILKSWIKDMCRVLRVNAKNDVDFTNRTCDINWRDAVVVPHFIKRKARDREKARKSLEVCVFGRKGSKREMQKEKNCQIMSRLPRETRGARETHGAKLRASRLEI